MEIIRPPSKQPVPQHAKRVFQGVVFDVYQWEQEGYDGKVRMFEKLKRPDTVLIIPVTSEGQIMLTRQEQPGRKPKFAFPGGRVDAGEDVFAAAQRELLEETGYTSDSWDLLEAVQTVTKIEWAVYYFVAQNCVKVAEQRLDGAEKVEIIPKSWDEFIQLVHRTDSFEGRIRMRILEGLLDAEKMTDLKKKIMR
jgi:8-oxo-dGTP pyrophosphatase MutT (NUDIX family)